MPRPILKPQRQEERNTGTLRAAPGRDMRQAAQMDKMKLDRMLRKPRSKAYMEALRGLDAGGHVQNQARVDGILEAVRGEFPEIELSGILLGYVAKCYLGKPYEVHTLDVGGGIIEHYQAGQPLPGGMEKARSIAMRGGYEFIEVYTDCCRAVSANGAVSVVPG